ncbi:sensor histidine kinase [Pyxidicoccus parkwayensis]|jgi:signal transduction histidine kinase|nr:GAF domain-containing sensor histidine kinase [Pyxidicoccus parkwaysis]
MDTRAEEAFDRLTRLACRILRAPMGLVSLLDEERHFCKSCIGLPEPWLSRRELPLTHSLCKYTLAAGDAFVVDDAREDPLLRECLGVAELGVVAYAGVPLVTSGQALGTFCVLDTVPRQWTEDDVHVLQDLAASVMTEVELRATRELELAARLEHARREAAEESRRRMSLLADAGELLADVARSEAALQRLAERIVPDLGDVCVVELLGGAPFSAGPRMAHVEPTGVERLRAVVCNPETREVWRAVEEPGLLRLSTWDVPASREGLGALLPRLGILQLLRVPVRTTHGVEGLLTVGRCSPEARPYPDEEVEVAQALTARIAVALENARILQQVREGVRSRDEFLSIAAHELRTPLTPLRLQLDTLRRSVAAAGLADERVTRHLERSSAQVQRLAQLVERLLDVSRVATGRLGLLLEELDLSALAMEVTDRFREEAEAAGSKLEVHTPGPVCGVWDQLRLEQVLSSLLSNAIKYGASRPIAVSVEGHGELARLCVQDQGIGLKREDTRRIFDRFERAVSARHYGGMGLGLYVAKQIIEAHGGTILVRSQPGKGSTFTVILPTSTPPRQVAGDQDTPVASSA